MAVYYKGREINEIDYVKVIQGGSEGDIFEPLGYTTPQYILDNIDYAQTIKDNWDASITNRYNAFRGDNKLVFFPSVDTSNVTNMNYMFSGCTNLQYVPELDVSNVTEMAAMFGDCSGLTSLDVSNFDTSNVTRMDYMFLNCTSLTSLDVSNFDTSNVIKMGYMFQGCTSLTSLDVSNFDTSKVTSMGSMFAYCSGLTSLDLSNFDTSNVTSMLNMFQDSSKLTSLDLSNWNTSKVTNMGFMFRDCSGLTSLDLSSFDTSNVTSMSYMFGNCYKLQRIDGFIDWTKISSYPSGFITSNSTYAYPLRYMTIKNLGKTGTTFNFNNDNLQNWGDESDTTTYPLSVGARQSLVDSLLTYSFDRAANGLSNCTIQLHQNVKARLTADEITAIQNKGYTIS